MAVQPRRGNDLRGLKALVGFLGVLVILGTTLVIGIVIHRLYDKPKLPAPGPSLVPGVAAPVALPGGAVALPPASNLLAHGEHIGGIAAVGGKLAIWISAASGDRLLLLDPATGKVSVALAVPQSGQ